VQTLLVHSPECTEANVRAFAKLLHVQSVASKNIAHVEALHVDELAREAHIVTRVPAGGTVLNAVQTRRQRAGQHDVPAPYILLLGWHVARAVHELHIKEFDCWCVTCTTS
jgi:hypothetical protein